MNKSDLINAVAEKSGVSKATAERVIDAFNQSITDALSTGDAVQIVGFGTYGTSSRAARKGRNPKTGDVITINARNVISFKPGKALKDAVN